MIEKWRKELETLGFVFKKWPGGGRTFIRDQGFLRQHIWDESWRLEKGKRVNTYISIKDPFHDDPDKHAVLLGGFLDEKKVVLTELGQGAGRFWTKEEHPQALTALLQYGIPWLEENTNAEKLIELFERGLREGVAWEEPKPSGLTTRLVTWLAERTIFRHGRQTQKIIRRPPIYHNFLTLLYYHVGNKDMSCTHAKEWYEFCYRPNTPYSEDVEWVLRLMSNLGCQPVGDETEK